jgi:hypothetical protein
MRTKVAHVLSIKVMFYEELITHLENEILQSK